MSKELFRFGNNYGEVVVIAKDESPYYEVKISRSDGYEASYTTDSYRTAEEVYQETIRNLL